MGPGGEGRGHYAGVSTALSALPPPARGRSTREAGRVGVSPFNKHRTRGEAGPPPGAGSCHRAGQRPDPLGATLPFQAGLSHVEILESQPGLGPAGHADGHAEPWNRIGNRPESDRERPLSAFDVFSSRHSAGHEFFPHAIPLPFQGEGLTPWQTARAMPYPSGGGGRPFARSPSGPPASRPKSVWWQRRGRTRWRSRG
jgi:hypothetical protein